MNARNQNRKKQNFFTGIRAAFLLVLLTALSGCGRNITKKANVPPQTPALTKTPAATVSDTALPSPELTEEERKEAYLSELLKGLSPEEKVGQMFLVRCPEDAADEIRTYALGGCVLFRQDFEGETKSSLMEKLASYQEASDIPLLFAVDEEGGTVVRVSCFSEFRSTPFRSPQEVFSDGGMEAVAKDAKEKAELLLSLGIQVNLAPVCDVSESPKAYMYERSFGKNAEETSAYVKTAVSAMKEAGLGCVLKHFPGYGSNADTHEGLVYDSRPLETYTKSDFKPFLAGMEAGAGAIMVSHNIVQCMDAGHPASISENVHRILREELGFTGVILTDDLYMDGIQKFTGEEEAAVAAVLAGNDMLCCTDFKVQLPAVIAALKDGRIPEEQIDASVLRILRWKAELGIISY